MDQLAPIIAALSGLAWPALLLFLGYYFRNQIADLYALCRQQVAAGGAIKWKEFEFKGVDLLSFDVRDGRVFHTAPADDLLVRQRGSSYAKNKNLFLVHRVRPTGKIHEVVQVPTYDISVYLTPHKNFGRMNDIKAVEYYFGKYFGKSEGAVGAKYIVENGSEDFAVRINAYGPMLCEARIIFHDGTVTTVSRYLDFEGTGYKFRAETNEVDQRKSGRKKKN